MSKTILLLLVLLLLGGCALGPDYERPSQELPINSAHYEDLVYTHARWWESFNDPLLNQLEIEALAKNRNLLVAMARVEEAAAAAGIALADRLPQIGSNFSGSRQQITQAQAMSYGPTASRIQNAWQAAGLLSFEIDLWGKYRRLDEAARAELLASEAARDAVQLTLCADVAYAYFQMLSLKAQCLIANNMVKTYQESVRIFQARLEAGLVQEIDLRRVEAELATNSADLHLLQNQLNQIEGVLSVLLGRNPKDILANHYPIALKIDELTPPPDIPDLVPSDLLTRRPDIRQAEGLLIAANAHIGAARAAFLPSISLTAGGGYASSDLDRLFIGPSSIWNFIGNLTQPLFHGGRLIAAEAMAQARYRQMLANYELTISQAFRDTRDALENNRQRRLVAGYREDQLKAMERSLYLANKQYEQGTIGLMDLLDVRRNLLRAQLGVAESRLMQLTGVVLLCKSLGGGWNETQGFSWPGQEPETLDTTDTALGVPQPAEQP